MKMRNRNTTPMVMPMMAILSERDPSSMKVVSLADVAAETAEVVIVVKEDIFTFDVV